MNTLILYHKDCYDGAGAAWAVTQSLEPHTYLVTPIQYGESLPALGPYKKVIIVDWCPKQPELDTLIEMATSGIIELTILDHHKSALKQVCTDAAADVNGAGMTLDRKGCYVRLDTNFSGAILAWRHFHGQVSPPELLMYIQDRDLWTWNLLESKEVNAALRLNGATVEGIQKAINTPLPRLAEKGAAILEARDAEVKALARHAVVKDFGVFVNPDRQVFYQVPITNCSTPSHISELGHVLSKGMPFSATYFLRGDDTVVVSLRSEPKGIDVSEIATSFPGGGGHKHAAGFSCMWDERPWHAIL